MKIDFCCEMLREALSNFLALVCVMCTLYGVVRISEVHMEISE